MMAVVLLLPLMVPRAKSDHETPKTSLELRRHEPHGGFEVRPKHCDGLWRLSHQPGRRMNNKLKNMLRILSQLLWMKFAPVPTGSFSIRSS